MRFLLYIFVFFFLAAVALGNRCPGNQEYSKCHQPVACRLTCENYQNPPEVCIALCVEGCGCPSHLALNSAGNCVPTSQC
ncbi:hypothetical protein ILUMI_12337 [Ignelater luminosus]|uniref:TIL domain-containing protein n=1 Tax=Ignelater luminosus TaxID=2038154 RepID=A0A8K0GBW3_IGNLU|nr:hypothetical protein ILUMI_12337 [Ignelater luminosus]